MTISLERLPDHYELILCDLWGCVHNGVRAFPAALARLRHWRDEGRIVLFLTNAPRPSAQVREQLDRLGVSEHHYDGVVSSGDAGIEYCRVDYPNVRLGFIGSGADREALAGAGLWLGGEDDGSTVVCCGFEIRTTDLSTHEPLLDRLFARGAQMLCFNPDILVLRGDEAELCAGALAARYAEKGGQILQFGKPHAPIYDSAFALAHTLRGGPVERHRTLVIGDSVSTDLTGAADQGLDAVFVTSGIEAPRFSSMGEEIFSSSTSAVPVRPLVCVPFLC